MIHAAEVIALQRVFGGSITELKGKLSMRFVRVETFDGEECAVVESKGKITGVANRNERWAASSSTTSTGCSRWA